MCSGEKSCIRSREKISKNHAGYFGDCHFDNYGCFRTEPNFSGEGKDLILMRKVFYFCQENFPAHCKHLGKISPGGKRSTCQVRRQSPVSNWKLQRGSNLQRGDSTVRLPDFVVCKDFGSDELSARDV